MKVAGKEIAKAINKTSSAVSYIKKNNPAEFELLKLGVLVSKLKLSEEDLILMEWLKKRVREEQEWQ